MKRLLFLSAHVVLVALIVIQLWRIAELLVQDSAHDLVSRISQQHISILQSGSKRDIEALVSASVFGLEQQAGQVSATVKPESAPASARSYRIASLAYSSQPASASVVLEIRPGDMELFKVGDEVEPGVHLDTIYSNGILIQSSSRAERIDYVRVRQPALIRVRADREGGGSNDRRIVEWSWLDQWERLGAEEVLSRLGLRKHGTQFIVESQSILLSVWGLSSGDRVLSLNGVPLNDSDNIKTVLDPIRLGGVVHMLVENDRRRSLVRWSRSM